jgi:hypothetical protein
MNMVLSIFEVGSFENQLEGFKFNLLCIVDHLAPSVNFENLLVLN